MGGSSAVTVTVASSDTALSVSPATLNFDATNWITGITVTVTAGSDTNALNETYTVTHTASGADYGSVARSIEVTVDDDDENQPAYIKSGRSLPIDDVSQLGETLTANFRRGAIADPDGLADSWPFEVQWVRVADDDTEVNIPGARGPCASTGLGEYLHLFYSVQLNDVGYQIGYRILFEDRRGNLESVLSDLTPMIVDPVRLISAVLVSDPPLRRLSDGEALFVPGDTLRFKATVDRPVSNPAISLTTATAGRQRCPKSACRSPSNFPSTRIRARTIALVTPSPPFRCPHAVYRCPPVDSGLRS